MVIKAGVKLEGLMPEIIVGLLVVQSAFRDIAPKSEFVITAMTDGKHMKNSLHYKGLAVDIRSNMLDEPLKFKILHEGKRRLGANFDFILEGLNTAQEHYHLEFDPK